MGYLGTLWKIDVGFKGQHHNLTLHPFAGCTSWDTSYPCDFTSGLCFFGGVVCGVHASCALTGSSTWLLATTQERHDCVTYWVIFARNTPKGRRTKPIVAFACVAPARVRHCTAGAAVVSLNAAWAGSTTQLLAETHRRYF